MPALYQADSFCFIEAAGLPIGVGQRLETPVKGQQGIRPSKYTRLRVDERPFQHSGGLPELARMVQSLAQHDGSLGPCQAACVNLQ